MRFFRVSYLLIALLGGCIVALPGCVWLTWLSWRNPSTPWYLGVAVTLATLIIGGSIIPVAADYWATRRRETTALLHSTVIAAVEERLGGLGHPVILHYGPDRLELEPPADDDLYLSWVIQPEFIIGFDPDSDDWRVPATYIRITTVNGYRRVFCGPATQFLYRQPDGGEDWIGGDTTPHHERLPQADTATLNHLLAQLRSGEEELGWWRCDEDGNWHLHQTAGDT
jgi:hypothetical protein